MTFFINMLNYNLIKLSKLKKKLKKCLYYTLYLGHETQESNKCASANISRSRKDFELKFLLNFLYVFVKVLN